MNTDTQAMLDRALNEIAPVLLPPADYPPGSIVRDTPRDELKARVRSNAEKAGIELGDEHWEVIDFLFDFYSHCCEESPGSYLNQMAYWKHVDDRALDTGASDEDACPYGKLSAKQATRAFNVYRVLVKAFKDKGGKKHLYRLFPMGPVFTIHLLAQLPRLRDDVDPHYGTAF